jgi:hypothetical protein
MKIRFHRGHVWVDPGFTLPPKMTQAEAAALIERGDEESLKKVIEGHLWISCDITGRFIHKLNVNKRQGENLAPDLLSEGFVAITSAVYRLKKCPRNVAAYLSAAVEKCLSEYHDCDNLCPVPPRTQRNRIAKGKAPVVPPNIAVATDLASDEKESNTSVLTRLGGSYHRYDFEKLESLYDYCKDQTDRDIIDLRYDGVEPRAMGEVAKLIGVHRGTVERRLKKIEARLFADLERKVPEKNRGKGKQFLKARAQAKVEAAVGSGYTA